MTTKDGRNIYEVWTHIIINSHNFIYTHWFCSHSEASVPGHEIFTIKSSVCGA